jgi:ABC-type multidrug transport system ATPase subunit
MRKLSAFVGQQEDLFLFLTVFETFEIAAYLHLPSHTPRQELRDAVEGALTELGLEQVRDSRLVGISGGERRRTAIGRELLASPSIVFLDEPTSGLDSFQALSVAETLRRIAEEGRVVVAVIHQPRSSIFSMFDSLVLLAEGRVVYSGPARDCLGYFASLGFVCPVMFNPADFVLDLVGVDARVETRDRLRLLQERWTSRVDSPRESQEDKEGDSSPVLPVGSTINRPSYATGESTLCSSPVHERCGQSGGQVG